MKSRIDYLDGFRGIAILLVVSFHAYSRWTNIVPYGDAYRNFPLFKFGWLGVQLFFIISGYVIFMTLDKTTGFRVFIYKRFLRLFPAMLIASILIFVSAKILDGRPAGSPSFLSLIPGLTFMGPDWWSALLGVDIIPLEDSFWSLYVEFKFYIVAGAVYYFAGRNYLIPALLSLFIGSVFIHQASEMTNSFIVNSLMVVSDLLSLKHFGWFCSGAAFYMFNKSKVEKYYLLAMLIAILSSLSSGRFFEIVAALMISGLFAASLKFYIVHEFLTNRIFLFFGLISYPLYLLHENAMISIVLVLPRYLPWLNMFFYPLVPLFILSVISFLIAKKYEQIVRHGVEVLGQLMLGRLFQRTR